MFRRFSRRRTTADLPPIVRITTTSDFTQVFSTGSLQSFRPVVPEGWFVLGDYATDTIVPLTSVLAIQVENDDPDNPALVRPEGFSSFNLSLGQTMVEIQIPRAPFGYVACGAVTSIEGILPLFTQLRCVRYDLVTQLPMGPSFFDNVGNSGGGPGLVLLQVPFLNLFWASPTSTALPNAFVPTACLPG